MLKMTIMEWRKKQIKQWQAFARGPILALVKRWRVVLADVFPSNSLQQA